MGRGPSPKESVGSVSAGGTGSAPCRPGARMGQQFSWEEAEENGAVGAADAAQLQEWYKKFLEECPSGTLFMHEFKRFFKVPDNEEATQYVEAMFRAFDTNGVRCGPRAQGSSLTKGAPSVGAPYASPPARPRLFFPLHPLSPFLSHCSSKLFSLSNNSFFPSFLSISPPSSDLSSS